MQVERTAMTFWEFADKHPDGVGFCFVAASFFGLLAMVIFACWTYAIVELHFRDSDDDGDEDDESGA